MPLCAGLPTGSHHRRGSRHGQPGNDRFAEPDVIGPGTIGSSTGGIVWIDRATAKRRGFLSEDHHRPALRLALSKYPNLKQLS
jgi:hypothetical protein